MSGTGDRSRAGIEWYPGGPRTRARGTLTGDTGGSGDAAHEGRAGRGTPLTGDGAVHGGPLTGR
ncbi:hypothetical protein STRIP9103_02663, partial [Streptomyces ipomoeae 91-03]